MASIISAGTTSGTSLNLSADTSGQLELKTGSGPTTAITISSAQLTTIANDATISGLTVGKGAGSITTNSVVGLGALPANTSGLANTAMGSATMASNTTGGYNSAYGRNALGTNTTGSNNTALGYNALVFGTTGGTNTAVGDSALFSNTTADNNTAVGYQAGFSNTTGTIITAIGRQALYANTTGTNNTALGYAMVSNTTGSNNTAIGATALQLNTTGSTNTAVGRAAFYTNTTGAASTAVGDFAGYSNTTGTSNAFFGQSAGNSNTTGGANTFLGREAGYYCTTGSGNTYINPNNSSLGYSPVFSLTTENNRVAIGSTSVTNAYIQVAWTVVSDARDKTNIADVPHGLSFVQQLKPVSYQFKTSREDDTPNGNKRYGFLAQDILALENNDPVVIDNEQPEKLRYNGESLVPILVKAIQELNAKVDAQAAEIAALKGAQ